MEGKLRLPGAVDVRVLLRLHATVVVIKHGFDNSVTNSLKMICTQTISSHESKQSNSLVGNL